jgi:hypothetical protein
MATALYYQRTQSKRVTLNSLSNNARTITTHNARSGGWQPVSRSTQRIFDVSQSLVECSQRS